MITRESGANPSVIFHKSSWFVDSGWNQNNFISKLALHHMLLFKPMSKSLTLQSKERPIKLTKVYDLQDWLNFWNCNLSVKISQLRVWGSPLGLDNLSKWDIFS